MSTLVIDPEFRDLIPPLTEDERRGLEESLRAEGCRDKGVRWGTILIDGHNRNEICGRLGIPFETVEHHFADRDAVKIWIIKNQFNRRNLTPMQRVELVIKLEPLLTKENEKRMLAGVNEHGAGGRGKKNPEQKSAQGLRAEQTRDELAALAGVSHDTVSKAKKILASPVKELSRMTRSGAVSINAAAAVAELPEMTQQTIIAAGPSKVKETASAMNAAKKKAEPTKKKTGRVVPFKQAETTWITPWLDRADVEQMAHALIEDLGNDLALRLADFITRNLKGAQHV
jgi:hypothetical protein